MYNYLLTILILLFLGCTEKSEKPLDGKRLLETKCAACHNLDLPPRTYEDEKAPPMMAVAFHLRAFVPANSESDKVPNAIEFIKDYVMYPNAKKSYCDKKSLQDYGVMPSQKGKVTQEELQAISKYIFHHFTQKNLSEAQMLLNKLNALSQGERLALKNGCLGCHKQYKDAIGPSFEKIALRYKGDTEHIINSIKSGSQGKWKEYNGVYMPQFSTKLTKKEIKSIVDWIIKAEEVQL